MSLTTIMHQVADNLASQGHAIAIVTLDTVYTTDGHTVTKAPGGYRVDGGPVRASITTLTVG